jgi:hypothetical protein
MTARQLSVTAIALPVDSAVTRFYPSTDLADAYAIALPGGASTDPEQLARFIFAQQPNWIGMLTRLRDLLVAGFGLKTAGQLAKYAANNPQQRVGIFKIYARSGHEIVLGEDDSHLDFRLSVLCAPLPVDTSRHQLVLSTVVHCHNRLGRVYLFLIAPFHRLVVKASLRQAARVGWPSLAGR